MGRVCADIHVKKRKADKFAKKRTLWEDWESREN
nr:MAG TPA: hypothetical protein [Caudoviricetes sp.]